MRRVFPDHYDRWLLGLIVAAVATSLGWFWRAQADVRRIRALPVTGRWTIDGYKPVDLRVGAAVYEPWAKPAVQSAGTGWLYEIFTPPVVFYHKPSAAFTVMPPLESAEATSSFNLELLGVKPELYRLQLAGYFGEPGAYTAVFTSAGVPGALRARAGEELDELGITLKSFSVRRVALDPADEWPVDEVAAFAELVDGLSGSTVILDSRRQKFTDASLAIIKLPASDGIAREVHEGDLFSDHDFTYSIAHIQRDPAEVVVSRHQSGAAFTETRILRPAPADNAETASQGHDSKNTFHRPATGIATNKK